MNIILLIITLLAIASAPGVYLLAQRHGRMLSFLDGFVLVAIAGLVLLDVMPHAVEAGGYASWAFAAAGLWGPSAVERLLHRLRRQTHAAILALAIAGLVLHSLADGTALAPSAENGDALGLAVVLHTLPVGLLLWWLMYPVFGARLPSLALLAMAAGTLAGYLFGLELDVLLGRQGSAWLQALVAGSVLHVAFGRPHFGPIEQAPSRNLDEGLGNLAGLLAVILLIGLESSVHARAAHGGDTIEAFGVRLLALAAAAAPALLGACLLAGFVHDLRRRPLAEPPHGARAFGEGLRAALLGFAAPLPPRDIAPGLTPVPASRSLLDLVALALSIPLLGWRFTALRLACAVAIGAVAAALRLQRPAAAAPRPRVTRVRAAERLRRSLKSGLVDIIDRTVPGVVAGLVLAAAAAPLIEQLPWRTTPDALEVLLLALLGLPLRFSAAAMTPPAAVLLAGGASPGAVLALLLVAPADALAAGPRAGKAPFAWPLTVYAGALTAGLALHRLSPSLAPPDLGTPSDVELISLALLCGLLIASVLRLGGRGFLAGLHAEHGHPY